MSKYKYTGIFLRQQTSRRWIVSAGGEEFPFVRKNLAVKAFKACLETFPETRLIEETTMNFKSPAGITRTVSKPIRIDITSEASEAYKNLTCLDDPIEVNITITVN